MTSMQGRPLTELGLSGWYYNPLRRAGIHTLEELCARTREEIRALRGVGMGCLKAIEEALTKRGLCLAAEPTADVVNCICPDRPALVFWMGNRQGEILWCPKCSRLLYRSTGVSVQTWYRPEASPSSIEG